MFTYISHMQPLDPCFCSFVVKAQLVAHFMLEFMMNQETFALYKKKVSEVYFGRNYANIYFVRNYCKHIKAG